METLNSQAIESISEVSAAEWDALVPDHHPFVRHAFLSLLEAHGGVTHENGWQPLHLTLRRKGQLVGAIPLYLKSHSWGEFVFDWAWAEAYERHGRRYYPKLLGAVPLSPVVGPRLLSNGKPEIEAGLAEILIAMTGNNKLSSAHVNFVDDKGADSLRTAGFLERRDWQYHWINSGEACFDDFLGRMKHKKRKNIRQERARVRRDGWRFRRINGNNAQQQDWDALAALYRHTFERKGNWALLSPAFFHGLGEQLADDVVLVLGERGGQTRAGALLIRSAEALHGRYWGTTDPSPGLHFETCYYQGIDHCIENRIARFDPGAQGAHKIPRGFLPYETRSFHFIAAEDLRTAITDFLDRELIHHRMRGEQLRFHSPFRQDGK